MPPPKVLQLDAAQHPDAAVRQVGFALDDPYVEHVWVGVLGPSGTLLLRRLPQMWQESMPARVDAAEFAASLGLLGGAGSRNGRMWKALRRLATHGLATQLADDRIGVYVQVPPLSDRLLDRVPDWTGRAHDRLLGDHLHRLAHQSAQPSGPAPTDLASRLSARLAHMNLHGPTSTPGVAL